MKEYVGVCAYCGQAVVSDLDFSSQPDADVWATENCSCPEAEMERVKRDRVRGAEARVVDLFGRGCEKYGFRPVDDGTVLLVIQLVRMVAHGDVDRMTAVLPFSSGGKVTAALTSKGTVKVTRSVGNALAFEI